MAHEPGYPTGLDLMDALSARGILSEPKPTITALSDIMEDVCHAFERDTGWVPFLNTGDAEEETDFDEYAYSPNGQSLLFLNRGILTLGSIELTDSALVLGEDFWLEPSDQTTKTRVRFAFTPSGLPGCIVVDAIWGYCSSLTEDMTAALLAKGMLVYMGSNANNAVGIGGAAKRIKQDDVEKEYDADASLTKMLQTTYDRAVMRYAAPWKVLA